MTQDEEIKMLRKRLLVMAALAIDDKPKLAPPGYVRPPIPRRPKGVNPTKGLSWQVHFGSTYVGATTNYLEAVALWEEARQCSLRAQKAGDTPADGPMRVVALPAGIEY